MTCIVGLEYGGKVYIGGDSASASGWSVDSISESKVFKNKEFIIGYTSSFRMGQLLQYSLEIPENKRESEMEYLVKDFITAVRSCLKDNGYAEISSNKESGGIFLVGYRGKLYRVSSDFQIMRYSHGYYAVGAGEEYALGSMFSSKIKNPKDKLTHALETASNFCGAVVPPFIVISQ